MVDDRDATEAQQRWDTWVSAEQDIVDRGLAALAALPGRSGVARLVVVVRPEGECERIVTRHAVDLARFDGGREVASALLRALSQQLALPFDGTLVFRWSAGVASASKELNVRVGVPRHGELDMWRHRARFYRANSQRNMDAMVDMFGASSSVIRAAGDAGRAMSGAVPPPGQAEPDPFGELLRAAEKAGVLDLMWQLLDGARAVDPGGGGKLEPRPPSDTDFDAVGVGKPEMFDAWSLVGLASAEELLYFDDDDDDDDVDEE